MYMNALISHPDIIRWIIWSWDTLCDNRNWENYFSSLFLTFASKPINIVITKNSISIFDGIFFNLRSAPDVLKQLWQTIHDKKDTYFKHIDVHNVFKDIKCHGFIYNDILNKKIDRYGWICWSCWWILTFNITKWFLVKDLLTVGLSKIKHIQNTNKTTCLLPPAPFITKKFNGKNETNFLSIYNMIQQPIYNVCLKKLFFQRGYGSG